MCTRADDGSNARSTVDQLAMAELELADDARYAKRCSTPTICRKTMMGAVRGDASRSSAITGIWSVISRYLLVSGGKQACRRLSALG